ncbi:MAG: hypothetical protein R3E90_04970 [Marinicella sp.]|nr:hypothetical protein [Xanthomonadales bacterium]
MEQNHTVFTPLRIALIIAIFLANLLAVISLGAKQQPWSEAMGVFAVVFIMLFVFVILLELVWIHQRSKSITDGRIKRKYRLAKIVYSCLFGVGFFIAYLVLMT